MVGLGTAPGECDTVDWQEVSPHTHSWCMTGLSLVHTTTYYLTVTAINGGIKERNVTVSSNGGRQYNTLVTQLGKMVKKIE